MPLLKPCERMSPPSPSKPCRCTPSPSSLSSHYSPAVGDEMKWMMMMMMMLLLLVFCSTPPACVCVDVLWHGCASQSMPTGVCECVRVRVRANPCFCTTWFVCVLVCFPSFVLHCASSHILCSSHSLWRPLFFFLLFSHPHLCTRSPSLPPSSASSSPPLLPLRFRPSLLADLIRRVCSDPAGNLKTS